MSETESAPSESASFDAPRLNPDLPHAAQDKVLSAPARRALEEAMQRQAEAEAASMAPEQGGRRGPEPTRYGDWEKKGLAVDF